SMAIKSVLRFRVKSVKEGETRVEMSYLENVVEAQGLPGANVGDKLKGVTFLATLDKAMKVTKLEGYDKFLEALAGDDADQKKLMKSMMPEATIRQMFGQTFAVAPGEAVGVGDTWKQEDKIALGPLGTAETKQTLKLDGVKDDVATIGVKGDMTFK